MITVALLFTLGGSMTVADAGVGEVSFVASVAKIPHQHPLQRLAGKAAVYLDLDGGAQVVAYFDDFDQPKPGWTFRVFAEELRFDAKSKRPGSDAAFPVVQHLVHRYDRLIDGESTAAVRGMIFGLFTPSHAPGSVEALEAKILGKGKAAVFELSRCADRPAPHTGEAKSCQALLKRLLGELPVQRGFEAWFEARSGLTLEKLRREAARSKQKR